MLFWLFCTVSPRAAVPKLHPTATGAVYCMGEKARTPLSNTETEVSNVKIGVALSGCDIGGVSAHYILRRLRDAGVQIDMISVSGTPSAAALLFATGQDPPANEATLAQFLLERRRSGFNAAVSVFSARLTPQRLRCLRGLVVCALNILDGKAVAFTNDFAYQTDTLRTFPLTECYDALGAALGAVDSPDDRAYCGCKLCDGCVRHGCPFYPLHMCGCDRILSFAFLPAIPANGYDVSIIEAVRRTGAGADVHVEIPFAGAENESLADYHKIAASKLESCMNRIYRAIAFGESK